MHGFSAGSSSTSERTGPPGMESVSEALDVNMQIKAQRIAARH
jgi:hypothetical protein